LDSAGVDLGETVVDIFVVPNIFATIATPHLGMKDMSYFKVPKFLEPLDIDLFGQLDNLVTICFGEVG